MRREDINVRATILSLEPGGSHCFPDVVKDSYIRNICSILKADGDAVCRVNRLPEGTKVTRMK